VDGFTQRFINNREWCWSEVFSLDDLPGIEFKVFIWPAYGIHLVFTNIGQHEEVKLSAKLWIESNGRKFNECVKQCSFIKTKVNHAVNPLWPQFKFANLKQFIIEDSLTICLKLKLRHSIEGLADEELKMDTTEVKEKELGKKIRLVTCELYSKGHFDIKIQAGGKVFKAFRIALVVHSEVFKRLILDLILGPNSVKGPGGLIKIEDTDAEIVEALLNWMHLSKIDNLDNISEGLFCIAHKYQVSPLLKICVQSMIKTLKLENLPSRIILSYVYDVEDLKRCIIRFIHQDSKNIGALISSDEGIDFASENRELAKQIGAEIGK